MTRRRLRAIGAALMLVWFGACRERRAAPPATLTPPDAPTAPATAAIPGLSPPARSFDVQQDSVAFEGHWAPIGAAPTGAPEARAVHVRCSRIEHWCREDLAQSATEAGALSAHKTLEYHVEEWTKWGTPAGKLLAVRHEAEASIELRVSLSGLAAERVVALKGAETRWRLE